jgi:hypothetical protein
MVKRIRKNIFLSPPNLAPLRLGGRISKSENFRPLKICRDNLNRAGHEKNSLDHPGDFFIDPSLRLR